MLVCFLSPVLIAFSPEPLARVIAAAAWLFMWLAYVPTLRFYRLAVAWGLLMPFTGLLFLIMTWDSARRYLLGERSAWRGRRYAAGRESVSR
jgi:hypothetical protein